MKESTLKRPVLWLLRPVVWDKESDSVLERYAPAWNRWDVAEGFVIRASSEAHARSLAATAAGTENDCGFGDVWQDPKWTTCERLSEEGPPGVILRDFRAG